MNRILVRTLSAALVLGGLLAPASSAQSGLQEDWLDQVDWRSIGPANMGGRIIDIEVSESDPMIWYVATASGGLLKSTNGGMTFEHLFDDQGVVSLGDVCVSPTNPDLVWVGTGEDNPRNSVSYGDGVYKSEDGGKTWKHMGLKESFQIGKIQMHPENQDVVYVGALGRLYGPNEERGLFKTTDGGETWEKVLYVDEQTGVIDVAMSPADPDLLLVATYERQRDGFDGNDPAKKNGPGGGLWRTTNGGKDFQRLSEGLPSVNYGRIGLDFYRADPNTVYAVIETELTSFPNESAGQPGFRGENAETGARVTRVDEGGAAAEAGLKEGDIILSVNDVIVLSYEDMMVQVRRHEAGDVLKVTYARAGEAMTCELTLKGQPEEEEEAEDQPRGRGGRGGGNPFSSGLGGQTENLQDQQGKDGHQHGGLFKSTDAGLTWTRVNSVNPRPMYYSQVRIDPSDENHQWVLGTSLYKSEDGGDHFRSNGAGRGVHVDNHAMWVDPNDGRHVLLGCDGGLYETRDRGENWDHLNFMAIGQFYHVEVGPRRNYMVYGGLQDNGTWGARHRSRGAGGPINEDWLNIGGGDGFVVRIDENEPDVVFSESQNGSMSWRNLVTGERGGIRPRPPQGVRYRWNWKTPFILSHHNSRIFYTVGNYVFRSLNRGEAIEAISDEITLTDQGSGSAVAESPLNANVVYAGTTDGALVMTKDGGKEWLDLLDWEGGAIAAAATEAEAAGDDQPGSGPNAGPAAQDAQEEPPAELQYPAAAVDDAISGTWNATMEGGERRGGGGFSFTLKLGEGNKVTGTLDMRMGEASLEGKFNPETGALTCTASSDMGESTLEGKVDGNVMTGSLVMDEAGFSLEFRATKAGGEAAEEAPARGPRGRRGRDAAPTGKPLRELIEKPMWVTSLEPSRYQEGRVYLALDGHRSDNDDPHVFVSEDFGQTWTSLRANLPRGSSRCLREDIQNENVLWLGTEFAAWVSIDRGQSWVKLNGDTLPTVAVHEFAQHRTSGELVAATHGRSLWIADVTPIRQMSAEVLAEGAHLFQPNDVVLWTSAPRRGVSTLSTFIGDNPPTRASVYFHLAEDARNVSLTIQDLSGATIATLDAPAGKGFHRVEWNLQRDPDPNAQGQQRGGFGGGGFRGGFRGRTAGEGTYHAVLTVNGESQRQSFEIQGDPEYPDYRYLAVEEELYQEWLSTQPQQEEEDGQEYEHEEGSEDR